MQLETWIVTCHRVDQYWIYEIETEDSVPANASVIDRRITRERWLLKPSTFRRIGRIPAFRTGKVFCGEPIGETSARMRRKLREQVRSHLHFLC